MGAGLLSGGQEVLGQAFTDGIGLAGIGVFGSMALGFFRGEVAPVPAFSVPAGAHTVGTRRCIGAVFEAVNEIIEGGGRRGVEGGKASDLGQAGMASQIVGPLGNAFIVELEHQEEGAQHTEGVIRWPPTRPRGIEGGEQRACRVEIEA